MGSILIIHQTLLGFVATGYLGEGVQKNVKFRKNAGVSITLAERITTLAAFHSAQSPGLRASLNISFVCLSSCLLFFFVAFLSFSSSVDYQSFLFSFSFDLVICSMF